MKGSYLHPRIGNHSASVVGSDHLLGVTSSRLVIDGGDLEQFHGYHLSGTCHLRMDRDSTLL